MENHSPAGYLEKISSPIPGFRTDLIPGAASSIMTMSNVKNLISHTLVVGLLFVLIFVSGCTDTSEPPITTAATQTSVVPVTSGTPDASVTKKIPATTITSGNPDCSSGQTLCDGSCIDTQNNSKHCGKCGNECNESEPCSEGTCLSWTGSWIDPVGWEYELTQAGTLVNGTDYYKKIIISGTTSGNPPRFTGTWTWQKSGKSFYGTFDMAPDGKSFTGGLLGKQSLTYTREED
ncbi:Stigma-specific protein, Stig1 [Methanoregula sp.]|uniref:Stigma-specific protein, Stig1 n=1 Tax=Methanoregula sp. TaxID=2052170 RepID=UPI0026243D5A|nr:Stigma-specific protein, Stig1 [Methanoregula sp.]MDD5144236.1 Stigma-specific protein, Stig1 [Methanoregula sp.]